MYIYHSTSGVQPLSLPYQNTIDYQPQRKKMYQFQHRPNTSSIYTGRCVQGLCLLTLYCRCTISFTIVVSKRQNSHVVRHAFAMPIAVAVHIRHRSPAYWPTSHAIIIHCQPCRCTSYHIIVRSRLLMPPNDLIQLLSLAKSRHEPCVLLSPGKMYSR